MSQTTATKNNTGTETVTVESLRYNPAKVAEVTVEGGTQWVRAEVNKQSFFVAEIVNEEIVVTRSSENDVEQLLDEYDAELVYMTNVYFKGHHLWCCIDNNTEEVRAIPRGFYNPEEVV